MWRQESVLVKNCCTLSADVRYYSYSITSIALVNRLKTGEMDYIEMLIAGDEDGSSCCDDVFYFEVKAEFGSSSPRYVIIDHNFS